MSKKNKKRMPDRKTELPSKYWFYEHSVQEAADDAQILSELFQKIRTRKPTRLREDFCGTFKVATEWVKLSSKNTAVGLDIDPEPIAYGYKNHMARLSDSQKQRIEILEKDVNSVTRPAADIVAACNFSYWIFKKREELIRYFEFVFKSMKDDGLFFLDHVGGYEMVQETTDKDKFGKGKNKFQYIWKQENYNPVSNEGIFSISYKLADGTKLSRVFEYDWRVWTIREIRECLEEAGFQKTYVFWEQDDDDDDGGNGEFELTEREENCPVHICYIAASKKST